MMWEGEKALELEGWRKDRREKHCLEGERRTESRQGQSGGGEEKKLSMCLCVRDEEWRIQSCSLAPGTTFLSAMASLSAKCTFDASPRMLL